MQVTQENLCNLIPPKAAKITTILRNSRCMAVKQALLAFYKSQAYRLLENEETKLWYASPAQIYAEYLSVPQRSRQSYQNGPGRSKLARFRRTNQTLASPRYDAPRNRRRVAALRLPNHRPESLTFSA